MTDAIALLEPKKMEMLAFAGVSDWAKGWLAAFGDLGDALLAASLADPAPPAVVSEELGW